MDERRIIAKCEECGEPIWDDSDYFIDEDNNFFCCDLCALEFHGVVRGEGNGE